MSGRAIIVGAARSGSGKTSVAIGLMRAFRRRDLRVAGAKSGPDYIDPGFHAAATGRPGVNLDSWAMPPPLLERLVAHQAADSDIMVVESAMGLFDGVRRDEARTGSAADLARRFGMPVLLVLDVSGQSQTAAVIAHGFATFDPQVRIAGVVLNQVASDRHEDQARRAIEERGPPVLGAIRRNPDMALPERHLGLVQAREHAALEAFIERLADVMQTSIDLDAVLSVASPVGAGAGSAAAQLPPPGQRIAIAEDNAFTFLYPHLARSWREAGAELIPFSPLADRGPDPSCDVCWLPGGYPELHAGKLAAAGRFKQALMRFASTRPVHGECGGYMVLGEALEDADGVTHAMTGLLSHATSFSNRKINLGYRHATLNADCVLGSAGAAIRGHEFHYSRLVDAGRDEPLVHLQDAAGNDLGPSGGRSGLVTGAFLHAIARDH
ncbi:MAG: cobyrinate a,c-diamide synthase [Dongiaceae bacterium]